MRITFVANFIDRMKNCIIFLKFRGGEGIQPYYIVTYVTVNFEAFIIFTHYKMENKLVRFASLLAAICVADCATRECV